MAEYYAVLKKAVAGPGMNSAEARRAVYDKARNALIGQLKAIDPPLPTSEISRQRLELEEAIRKAEREAAQNAPAAAPARPATPVPPASAARTPPAALAAEPVPAALEGDEEGPSPQDVFRRAIQEAEARGAAAAMQQNRVAVPVRAESTAMTRPELDVRPLRERLEPLPQPPAPREPERERERSRPLDPPPYVRQEAEAEPRLAPDYDYEWEATPAPQASTPSPFVDRRDRPPPKKGGRRKGYLEEDDREIVEREARPSRLPAILLFVLIVAMLGGLAALAWSQRAVLTDLLSSFDRGSGAAKPAAAKVPAEPPPAASNKNADRLLQGAGSSKAAGDKTVRVVDAPPSPPADQSAAPADQNAPAPPADQGAATPPATATVDQPPPADAVTAAAPAASDKASGDALVAQKAVLYEEPLDATNAANGVMAINASVTWTFVNGSDGPEIQAKLEVPDRKMKIRVAIHKNADKTLPASHLVEVVIDTPSDFPGKGIRAVPRVVMKPTEEARGQPLVGASAKVADGFFWIALSATDSDVSANLALMKDRDWIDLPFVYETGQRAILTFEKGTPGDRVFQKALTAWGGA